MATQTVSGENARVLVTPQFFDRIVAGERALVVIDTDRAAEVVAQFRQFAVRSGKSVYAWSAGAGIASLREGELAVPGSVRLVDALRYVQTSPQFGVYLFPDFVSELRGSPQRTQALALLRQFARGRGTRGGVRRIVLLGSGLSLDESIDPLVEHIADLPERGPALRLRDGRWVR